MCEQCVSCSRLCHNRYSPGSVPDTTLFKLIDIPGARQMLLISDISASTELSDQVGSLVWAGSVLIIRR